MNNDVCYRFLTDSLIGSTFKFYQKLSHFFLFPLIIFILRFIICSCHMAPQASHVLHLVQLGFGSTWSHPDPSCVHPSWFTLQVHVCSQHLHPQIDHIRLTEIISVVKSLTIILIHFPSLVHFLMSQLGEYSLDFPKEERG